MKLILEDRKLKSGDMVWARIGAKIYTAKILDADDPAKLLVDLDNGRKAVVDLVNDD